MKKISKSRFPAKGQTHLLDCLRIAVGAYINAFLHRQSSKYFHICGPKQLLLWCIKQLQATCKQMDATLL